MSFERASPGVGIGAEPGPYPGHAGADPAGGSSPALRLQILSTEHWSLLASRALAWNEAFSRAGMFLTTLTGAIVALALVAQASAFGEGFRLFALVILPLVLFVGVATEIRLGESNYHEALCVVGMNRIRAAYLELAPDLERYFVMSAHDDLKGMGVTMGMRPGTGAMPLAHLIAGTPTVVMTLNSVLAGIIAALAADQLGATAPITLGVGTVGFLVAMVLQGLYARSNVRKAYAGYRPLFPTPPEAS
ncbi:MAG: hypothetical protein ABJB39_07940 [Chloroflexota bacterium]